jgi:hypothetical protein
VTEQFASKAKEKRFAKEDRLGHRSQHRKPRGLLIKPTRQRSSAPARGAREIGHPG